MEGGEEGKLGSVDINEERKQVLSRDKDVEEKGIYTERKAETREIKSLRDVCKWPRTV